MVSWLFGFIGCWIVQGGILGIESPVASTWIITFALAFVIPFIMYQLPKMHYLRGVTDGRTKDALTWYAKLSSQEKKQLPKDWDELVLKHGHMKVPHDHDYVYHKYVAEEMHTAAREVVRLYNEAQKVDNTPVLDYRVDVHLQLMSERAQQLKQEITDRTEIQDKIREMP